MNRLILLFTLTLVSFVQSSLNNNNIDKCCCPSFKESKVQVLRNNGVITIIQNPRYSSINDYIATRENDAGHNQRIKEFGSLITPEIKTKVSQVFSVYGIKPRLVSIVINKKGNLGSPPTWKVTGSPSALIAARKSNRGRPLENE